MNAHQEITANPPLAPIGRITRLQVQTAPLKPGQRPHRWYDPTPIRAVSTLLLDSGGITGFDGEPITDVHHRDSGYGKFRGENGVSFGFTGHYAQMRGRFGDKLTDGKAGENILIETDRRFTIEELAGGLAIDGEPESAILGNIAIAAPCVEFSKFCAGYDRDRPPDRVIASVLQFLHSGMRGFYATAMHPNASTIRISVGAMVYLRRA